MANRYGSLTLQIKALSNLADVGSAYTDTLISANGTQELSKSGRGSFTVSARSYALLMAITSNIGQVAYVYITDAVAGGAAMDVCAFIIQDINLQTGDNGSMVQVSGPDLLHQLTYTTLDANVIDDGAGGPDTTDIDDIMAYAASGWTNTGGNSTNGTYYPSNGNNVLEALIAAAKQNGEMFRLSAMSPPAKTVQWLTSADASGVTLRMPASPIDYDASTTDGIILAMSENFSIGQVVTRIKPHGAGLRDGRLNIRDIDSGDTGGDPAGYTTYFNTTFPNTIVNDAIESSLGYIIKQDVDFSHITAEDVTDATQLTSAAVALWREGINYLQERDSSNSVYDIECVVPYDLRPGQIVTVEYTEYEGGQAGGSIVWNVGGDPFTIHRVTNRVGNSGDLAGVRITSLTVGASIVPRVTGASEIASALRTSRETTRKATPATAPGYIPSSRVLSTTQPLRIDGGAAADLSADRTLTVNGLTTVGTANQIPGTNSGGTAWEYKTLTNGTGINITHGVGTVTITNTGPSADLSGLPFVTIGNDATLSAERALTAGNGLTLTDGGVNSTATLDVGVSGLGLSVDATNVILTSSSNPGAAASILATDASGFVSVQKITTPDIASTAGLTITPAAGFSLSIVLSTTGDFIINTSQFVLDTSTGYVGIGTATPSCQLEIETGEIGQVLLSPTGFSAATDAAGKIDIITDQANFGMSFRVAKGSQRFTSTATNMAYLQYGATIGAFEIVQGYTVRIGIGSSGGVQIGSPTGGDKGAGTVNLAAALYSNGTQVLSSRKTGWAAATGTATRSTFATSTVTTAQLAERVKALIDDLISHGAIGA